MLTPGLPGSGVGSGPAFTKGPVAGGGGRAVFVGGRKAGRRIAVVVRLEVELAAAVGIVVGDVSGDVGVGHALGAPGPAVARDLAAGVEVVEEDEAFGEGVRVGGR